MNSETTPPADDVREALEDAIKYARFAYRNVPGGISNSDLAWAILSRFEVRPRGTVTDAEVEAAALCLGERFGHSGEHYVEDARAALEAARKVKTVITLVEKIKEA